MPNKLCRIQGIKEGGVAWGISVQIMNNNSLIT